MHSLLKTTGKEGFYLFMQLACMVSQTVAMQIKTDEKDSAHDGVITLTLTSCMYCRCGDSLCRPTKPFSINSIFN